VVVRLLIGRPIERGLDLLAAEHRLVEVPDEALRRGVGLLGRSEAERVRLDAARLRERDDLAHRRALALEVERLLALLARVRSEGSARRELGDVRRRGRAWPSASPPSGLAGPGGSRAA
jgi:hypothetical protein